MSTPLKKILESFSTERQEKIQARADELIQEELTLRQLREVLGVTQDELADKLDMAQANMSRLEHKANIKIQTLNAYVEALGGTLRVMADFPGKRLVPLRWDSSSVIKRKKRSEGREKKRA